MTAPDRSSDSDLEPANAERPDPGPGPRSAVPDARLGAPAIMRAVRVELLGLEHGLLGQLVGLIVRPGATSRHLADQAEHPLATALRLFLLANLVFFLAGPSVGLMNYSLDSLAGVPGYAELIRSQIGRLGVDAEVYRARFETAFDFRQPTLVIVMVPLLMGASALALRRGPVGRHLVAALLGLSWILLVWPVLRLADSVVGRFDPPLAVTVPLILALLLGSALWIWSRLGAGVFELRRWPGLGYGVALTAALVAALVLHGQVAFWVTFALLEFGL